MGDTLTASDELKTKHWKRFRHNALIFLIAGLGLTMFSIGPAENPFMPLLMCTAAIILLGAAEYVHFLIARRRLQG